MNSNSDTGIDPGGESKTGFAVVVVTYNRLALLKECIACVLQQTSSPECVVIIDNASTDGTKEYLDTLQEEYPKVPIIVSHESENKGGSGGFYRGLEEFQKMDTSWVLLIDDDAMLLKDYIYELTDAIKGNPGIHAVAGVVNEHNEIATEHRRYLGGLCNSEEIPVPAEAYKQKTFMCNIASFCGMAISRTLLERVGLPEKDFFISYDDTEYSMRIKRNEGILNVNSAMLDHKTKAPDKGAGMQDKTLKWRDYYIIRNSIYSFKKHGNFIMLIKRTMRYLVDSYHDMSDPDMDKRIALSNREIRKVAFRDGMKGKLGIDPVYRP